MMWPKVVHSLFGSILLLMLMKFKEGKYHVIQKSDTSDYSTLGSVFRTVTANSAAYCVSLCASIRACQSSMLMGQSCSLYTPPSTCTGEKISTEISSQYKIFYTADVIVNTAWEDARIQCMDNGMHLVAINTDIEQQAITNMLTTQGNLLHPLAVVIDNHALSHTKLLTWFSGTFCFQNVMRVCAVCLYFLFIC